MRLGKYLKVSHLIKRCAVANEAHGTGWTMVNGKVAHAPYEVKEGDVLELQLGVRNPKVRVVRVGEYTPKREASETYEATS